MGLARKREIHPLRYMLLKHKIDIATAASRLGISERQLKKYLAGELSIPLYVERLIDLNALGRKWHNSPIVLLTRSWEQKYCKRQNFRSRNLTYVEKNLSPSASHTKAKHAKGSADSGVILL